MKMMSILWPRFLLLFLITSMSCDAEHILDVETLPTLRTQQYSASPYKKIVVFSAPRTGSSLVYNVFRFLFEDEFHIFSNHNEFNQDRIVLRTHVFTDLDLIKEDDVLYVFTIRNPINAGISHYRIYEHAISNIRDFAKHLMHNHRDHLLLSEKMEKEGHHVVLIKYEDLVDNLDYLLNFIENRLLISILDLDKDILKQGLSKENIYACTANLIDFSESLPFSGFHGHHIALEKYIPPKKLLYWLNVYLKAVKPTFIKHGYFLD